MKTKQGVVVLPTILIFGAIIIGIVLTGIFIVQLINRSNLGIRLAIETSVAANTAIEDVHLRLIRGQLLPPPVICNDASPTFTDYDSLDLGRVTVAVKVCKYTCGVVDCRYRVRADAQALLLVKRRLEAVFDVDAVTGQIRVSSLQVLEF